MQNNAVSLLLHYRNITGVISSGRDRENTISNLSSEVSSGIICHVSPRCDFLRKFFSRVRGTSISRVTSHRVSAVSELIRHFWRTSEQEGCLKRSEGEICSRREKTKRSLFEDHRGIECYSSWPPHRASPRAHLRRLPSEGVGETVKSI